MKNIVYTVLVLGISVFTNVLHAQEVSTPQKIAFESDNIENFKKAFSKSDYDKCLLVKNQEYTMLSYSVRQAKKNVFNFLLNNKSDVNKACNGFTPLMSAAMFGNLEMAKILLKKGADKNAKDSAGETAKDYAVKYNQPELAKIL